MISRRDWLRITAGGLALGTAGATRLAALAAPAKEATVYKSATCGCCKKWVEHLEKNGYTVTPHDVADINVYKKKYGVPASLGSCHTAVVTGGYVIEGHVPADLIDKVVAQRPKDIVGLAVPGMPQGKTRIFARR
jgi:hypothetical protein